MVRRILIALLALGALVLCAGPASAASLHWSAARRVDDFGGIGLGAIACPQQDACDALDQDGRLVRFQPGAIKQTTTTLALDAPGRLSAIACPAEDQCTVIDQTGDEATFDEASPNGGVNFTHVDPAASDTSDDQTPGLACPSTTQCLIVDGSGNVVTFSPADPSAAVTTALDPTQNFGLVAIACPAATQCTAISQTRQWTFDPSDPASATTATIDTAAGFAAALACPSVTQCTSVDESGRETTFDPQTPTAGTPVALSSDLYAEFASVVCPTTTSCTGSDLDGNLESFDPQTGTLISRAPARDVQDLVCLTSTACLADDGTGDVLPFTPGAARVDDVERTDSGSALGAVACPSVSQCTAVDRTRELTFDPRPGATGLQVNLLPGRAAEPVAGLACPLPTLCSAVRVDQQVTFDPRRFGHPRTRVADHDGDGTFIAVRCPGRTECVAIDSDGAAVTYDPATGHIALRRIDVEEVEALTALACPTRARCTATDNDGTAISFDPLTGHRLLSVKIDARVGLDAPSGDSDNELDGIACRGTRSCVAVDTLGDVVSFDPASRHGATVREVDTVAGLTAVACPTRGLCVLTGADGRVFTGPAGGSRWTPTVLRQAAALTDVTCVSGSECVAVDAAGDTFTGR